MSFYVTEETALWHQRCDQHHLRRHTYSNNLDATRVFDRRHYSRLIQQFCVLRGRRSFDENFDSDWNFYIFIIWYQVALEHKVIS